MPSEMSPLHAMRRDVCAHRRDYLVALGMVCFAVVVLITRIDVQATDTYVVNPDTVTSWFLTIAVCATLAGRRRWPLRSLALCMVLLVPLELAGQRDSLPFFAFVFGLYSVAAHLPARLAWRGVAMVVALYAVLVVFGSVALRGGPQIGNLLLATAFTLGRLMRRTRERQERAAEAAIARAVQAAETADLAAADERLRLAQELHDVVAHSLSVIAVQAGIGAHLIDRQPDEAAAALDAIRTASSATSNELSRLVDVLRAGTTADAAPAPLLTDVAELVDQTRTTALPVVLRVDGDLAAAPAGVSRAAYRIVQEALTNVVRHAGRANATVTVRVAGDQLSLRIDDDGRGGVASDFQRGDHGHGLIGIKERAQMYGGEATGGPRPGGGFRVEATLRSFADPQPARAVAPVTPANADKPRGRQIPPWLWDVLLAASLAGVVALEALAPDPGTVEFARMGGWAWTLRIGCCLTLAFRRRQATLSYAAAMLAALALTVGDYLAGTVVFVLWIGLYTVASRVSTTRLVGALAGTYGALAVMAWSEPPDLTVAGTVFVGILFTAAAIAGFVVRRDRSQRNDDLAWREADAATRARRARLMIANERLRIADELNTIIARSIDAIALQASDPKATRATLETISSISRDALNDLRRLLKHLRTEAEPNLYTPVAPALAVAAAGDVT